jgi:hypothetical protein
VLEVEEEVVMAVEILEDPEDQEEEVLEDLLLLEVQALQEHLIQVEEAVVRIMLPQVQELLEQVDQVSLLFQNQQEHSHQESGHCKNNIISRKTTNGLLKYDLSFKSNLYYNNIGVKKIWHILQKLTVIT